MFMFYPLTPTGWLCPRCKRVCAPNLTHCDCLPETYTITQTIETPGPPAPCSNCGIVGFHGCISVKHG